MQILIEEYLRIYGDAVPYIFMGRSAEQEEMAQQTMPQSASRLPMRTPQQVQKSKCTHDLLYLSNRTH
jgi:hypothetical protein